MEEPVFDPTRLKEKGWKKKKRDPTVDPVQKEQFGHTYDEMLRRFYENVQIDPSERKTIPGIELQRRGRRTIWANFGASRSIFRDAQHVLQYICVEFQAQGSVTEEHLTIEGRYTDTEFRSVLKRYVQEYIRCKACHQMDTIFRREQGLYMVQCCRSDCGSSRSVPSLYKEYLKIVRKKPLCNG